MITVSCSHYKPSVCHRQAQEYPKVFWHETATLKDREVPVLCTDVWLSQRFVAKSLQ